jgi:hypothetical protein
MANVTVASLQNVNNDAVLKFQIGAMLVADAGASPLTTPFDPSGLLQAFPAGYQSAGYTDAGGLNVGRAITVSEVTAWQTVQPVRSDVTADKLTLKVKLIETNPVTLALQEGLTLAATTMTPTFSNARDSQGLQPQRRVILIAEDTAHDVIMVRYLPNAKLTAISSDESYQRATELTYDFQLDAYPSPDLLDASGNPTDSQFWFGGSGWATLAGELVTAPAWQATHTYSTLNEEITTSGGHIFKVKTAGTSGSTEPTWPASGDVTDGTVTWTFVS